MVSLQIAHTCLTVSTIRNPALYTLMHILTALLTHFQVNPDLIALHPIRHGMTLQEVKMCFRLNSILQTQKICKQISNGYIDYD